MMTSVRHGGSEHDPVVVAISTYKRPTLLAALLESLSDQQGDVRQEVVVVDNDPEASARGITARFPGVHYVVHATPGIAAARNRSIDVALELRPRAIAFIDDDETASADWLRRLSDVLDSSGADVVTGPVEYDISMHSPGSVRSMQYLRLRIHPEGSQIPYVATNNVIVRADWFRPPTALRFAEEFNLTGGEDLEFFIRLQRLGATCVWTQTALVKTKVPSDRLRRRWNLQREMRNGQLMGLLRMRFDQHTRIQVLVEGGSRILTGLRLAPSATRGRNLDLAPLLHIADGFGWVRAGMNILYEEYKR